MESEIPLAGEVVRTPLMAHRLTPEGADVPWSQLIERAAGGDAEAFEQIMIYSQRKVLVTTWRMLGNEEDARDATQEVFLRVYKYLRGYKPEQDFFGWLYRIVVNVCRDVSRKRQARERQTTSLDAELEAGTLRLPAEGEDLEEAALLAQRRALVARALADLPEKERAVVVLRDIEGLPTEEVARILGSSESTVRVQASSARTKIRNYCERLLRGRRRG